MVPFNYSEFINDLTNLVKSNVIPIDRIDDAVGRILLVKFTMGLFENPLADFSLVNELGSQVYLSKNKYQHSISGLKKCSHIISVLLNDENVVLNISIFFATRCSKRLGFGKVDFHS